MSPLDDGASLPPLLLTPLEHESRTLLDQLGLDARRSSASTSSWFRPCMGLFQWRPRGCVAGSEVLTCSVRAWSSASYPATLYPVTRARLRPVAAPLAAGTSLAAWYRIGARRSLQCVLWLAPGSVFCFRHNRRCRCLLACSRCVPRAAREPRACGSEVTSPRASGGAHRDDDGVQWSLWVDVVWGGCASLRHRALSHAPRDGCRWHAHAFGRNES